jgi:modulator of FtsH protease HflC
MDNNYFNQDEQNDKLRESLVKAGKTYGVFFFVIILAVILYNILTFRVIETEQSVVTRFGEIKRIIVSEENYDAVIDQLKTNQKLDDVEVVKGKGLFFKLPFIDNVNEFSDRLLTYNTNPREVTTRDKKKLVLDNFAQWRISNVALFKQAMKNERNAQLRLDDLIYSNLNKQIGRTNAAEIIADMDRQKQMIESVIEDVNADLIAFGMQVEDVRIRRTEPPKENFENIFRRMRTERERMAKKYRSEGEEEATKIRSQADKEKTVLLATAYEEKETIMGEGDAEATRIYAEAYSQDAEFYSFYQTLLTYKKLPVGTKVVVPLQSEFAKYLLGNE